MVISTSRPKGLSGFLFSRKSTASSQDDSMSCIVSASEVHRKLDVPDDIILEVADHMSSSDLQTLCLMSHRIHRLLLPQIHSSIVLDSNEKINLFVSKGVSDGLDIMQYMKKLVVQPNCPSKWADPRSEKTVDEPWLAITIGDLVSSGRLKSLRTFKWDGLEAPADTLWLALRECCPLLKNIGTCVGPKTQTLHHESHLFSFRRLTGFSLTTQNYSPWAVICPGQTLPPRLWEMLLVHSPDLSEITLEGNCHSTELWDIRQVLSGRWPRLKKLSLGYLSWYDRTADEDLMERFMIAHPKIEEFRFLGGRHGSRTSTFYLTHLPHLQTFSGKAQQIKLAPDLPSLQHVELTDWFSPSARFAEILRPFPTIISLSIYVNFLDNINQESCLGLYERVLRACPQILHFEISSTGPVFLKDFSRALLCAPNLRSFVLTRTRRLKNEDTINSALRIATEHPNIVHFRIRDVLDWDHYDQLINKYRLRQDGTYSVVHNETRTSRSLRVHEYGIGPFGLRFNRSYTRDVP